ncbi:DUF6507 family protein [Nocardiopsis sp. LOL_012]|uniref:DUF6507 family protein n=1 Tax=Nocardiopsis sp. LOL_012 TaxID=3345409 RepID=UPI003A8B471C
MTGEHLDLATRLEEASGEACSVPVAIALGEFAEHFLGVVGEMTSLSASATGGAGEATLHYVNGNLEMAGDAQANACAVPDGSGDPLRPH